MTEETPVAEVLKDQEAEPTLEDIEKLFADLLEQMSAASTKMTLLGKRIREATAAEPTLNVEDLERAYLALPVPRPSWFEYAASYSEAAKQSQQEQATNKKFALANSQAPTNTQHGYT